jgi:type IV secretory pathway TrbF-like protein
MSTPTTNGPATVDPKPPTEAYAQALKASELSQSSQQRQNDKLSRQNVALLALCGLLGLSNVVGWFRHSTEVKLVYVDGHGRSRDGGSADDIVNPTPAMVASSLKYYVTCLKTVSTDDVALDQCKSDVEDYMTQNLNPAHARDDVDAFYHAHNPKDLARTETLSVLDDLEHPLRVTRLGNSNTYFLQWWERLRESRGVTITYHSGSVVIAPPFVPTDDDMRHHNSDGVVVTQNELI